MVEQLRALKWSLQALAASASSQLALFPSTNPTADGLAVDFETVHTAVKLAGDVRLTAEQRDALAAIERKLGEMSRFGREYDAALWTDAALATDPQWDDVRRLAVGALEQFGWPADVPPAAERESTIGG
jgi:hypothetical protein